MMDDVVHDHGAQHGHARMVKIVLPPFESVHGAIRF